MQYDRIYFIQNCYDVTLNGKSKVLM